MRLHREFVVVNLPRRQIAQSTTRAGAPAPRIALAIGTTYDVAQISLVVEVPLQGKPRRILPETDRKSFDLAPLQQFAGHARRGRVATAVFEIETESRWRLVHSRSA